MATPEDKHYLVAVLLAEDLFRRLGKGNLKYMVDEIVEYVDKTQWPFILQHLIYAVTTMEGTDSHKIKELMIDLHELWKLDPGKQFPQQEIYDICSSWESSNFAELRLLDNEMRKKLYGF